MFDVNYGSRKMNTAKIAEKLGDRNISSSLTAFD
jgi:hypothetical protein